LDKNRGKLEDKNSYSKKLLEAGYIESYIDYFYLANQKTPDIISKYKRENNFHVDPEDTGIRHIEHGMDTLKRCYANFIRAEDYLRNNEVEKAIDIYMIDVYQRTLFWNKDDEKAKGNSNSIGDAHDILSSVFIIQKSINLSKRYQLLNKLIDALNKMGVCFKTNGKSSEDHILSMGFMEEAKNLVRLFFVNLFFRFYLILEFIYFFLAYLVSILLFI